MFDPEKTDPYYLMAYHTSGLKEVCSYLLDSEIYLMLTRMKHIIDLHNDWNTDFGEDRED